LIINQSALRAGACPISSALSRAIPASLQGAVGMRQVIYIENNIADHPKHARRKFAADASKVVAGVNSSSSTTTKNMKGQKG
jgi:hypothetical protein